MKPSQRARHAAAITLSKGKMYEYGVPIQRHTPLPPTLDLEEQFPFAIGTLGDFASEVSANVLNAGTDDVVSRQADVAFAAQILQAFDASKLRSDLSFELNLLAAAAFYLGDVPGRATVLVNRLSSLIPPPDDPIAKAVQVALNRPWTVTGVRVAGQRFINVLVALRHHFQEGGGDDVHTAIKDVRAWAYMTGTAHELLLVDILCAVASTRISNSAWTLLPTYSRLPKEMWRAYLARSSAIKEVWPSQRMLGDAGLYRGQSGVIQMPTSAGKTRATELIIRAAFLAGRTRLAVVVAPFRALCQEIADALRRVFREDSYQVNQLSDALQPDFAAELLDLLEIAAERVPHVVVLTPEKLLYVLRQEGRVLEKLGLIIYDEGHQFDTGARGVTYELLLTAIKRLLPASAQSVLVSAVIQNAPAVANWLLSDTEKVVLDRRSQTHRLVAFTSLPSGMDGQLHFNVDVGEEQDFSVPSVIVREVLPKRRGERVQRMFPTDESGSVALYLALRLAPNGGVAIYARTKASAAKIVRDAVSETFARGPSLPAPAQSSDEAEVIRFKNLFSENFGLDSYLTQGAELGLFAHHGNTPHGIRLSIEHAMREDKIRLVVCTSTLAQGVNLPIRYLLVTSPMQGREAIKARDFHNLMGRAGRAGMHGEGTVVFTDHRLYDQQTVEPERWEATLKMLKPENAEPTGSTLLELLEPMWNDYRSDVIRNPTAFEIATSLVDDRQDLYERVANLSDRVVRRGFSVGGLHRQLDLKKATVEAIESFLMTYRDDVDSEKFVDVSRSIARETLAFSLATSEQQLLLEKVFEKVAEKLDRLVPDVSTQARFGRALLGVDTILEIERWVGENFSILDSIESEDMLFEAMWPLFAQLSNEKRLKDTEPGDAMFDLACGWLAGYPFKNLLSRLNGRGAGYPSRGRLQQFTIDEIVGLCEQTFGFEFQLILVAVRSGFAAMALLDEEAIEFKSLADLLQKRLKYGLPSKSAISYFETGFSERVVAQQISDAIPFPVPPDTVSEAQNLVRVYQEDVKAVLTKYPSYFRLVFDGIVG